MDHQFLFNTFILLSATCIVVSLAGRFKLGSVLGYLAAGILIGPFGLGLIQNPEEIMHFAEFGVVMMLFLIGLELEPDVLWKLRKNILGLGGFQVLATSLVLATIGVSLGYSWPVSLSIGMALSLSSTALVLQLLEEKGLMQTSAGKASFAVLLFQDIAVIPILILLPFLAGNSNAATDHANLLSSLPSWLKPLIISGVILLLIAGGRFLARPLFHFIAKSHLREVFTATSLALIVGITLLMQALGVSPALGAFIAGVVLANSEYRHVLEADIQPFKIMLLGLFFISIGMGMNFGILWNQPLGILGSVLLLISVKALLLLGMGYFSGLRAAQNTLFATALAQGSEFAFVLFQYSQGLQLLDSEQAGFFTLTVALSMAATPLLMILNDRFVVQRFMSRLPGPEYDKIENQSNPVIIAGYGRFGQIIGRFLKAQGIPMTILENDPDQIELIRKFGNRVFFGDASELDLLRSAGAAKAKLLVVAVDDADKCLEVVALAQENFPNLKIFARARNRRHAYELHQAGADYYRRETFDSSLQMAKAVVQELGGNDIESKAERFREYDEKILKESFEFFEREPELIQFTRQSTDELERLLQEDAAQTQAN